MRKLTAIALPVFLLLAGLAGPVGARDAVVHCDAGDDLQAAIDAARPGGTLRIRGTCVGPVGITKKLRLQGLGMDATLRGAGEYDQPLVRIGPTGRVTMIDLRLTGGSDEVVLFNRGRLHLLRSRIVGNQTESSTIDNTGTLELTRSKVANNGVYDGAAIRSTGSLRILRSRVVGNQSDSGPGGIDNRGSMRLERSVVAKNDAAWGCGGIGNSGDLTIVDSTLRANIAGEGAGGNLCNSGWMLIIDSVIAEGLDAYITPWIHAGPAGGGIFNEGTATIRRTLIRGNAAVGWGGGIANLGTMTLADSEVEGNGNWRDTTPTTAGGGIWNGTSFAGREYPGELRIYRTRIHDNATDGDGGGIVNEGTLRAHRVRIYRNSAEDGGGIHNTGTLTLTKVKLRDNTPNDCTGC